VRTQRLNITLPMTFTRAHLQQHYWRYIIHHGDPCLWFAVQSMITWDRIGFVDSQNRSRRAAGRPELPITEETITENMLFDLAESGPFDPRRIPFVELWEAQYEPTEGNDLDLWVRYSFGWVHFMIQSKRLYENLRYTAIWHENRHGMQVDLLINASNGKGVPLYLLYNHVPNEQRNEAWCGVRCDETQYGCTVSYAPNIKAWLPPAPQERTTPTFSDLHTAHLTRGRAVPWIKLVCCRYDTKEDLCGGLGLNKEDWDKVLVSETGPVGSSFEYTPPSVLGENKEPVSYTPYTRPKGDPKPKERDPVEGRYFTSYLMAMDVR